MGNASNRPSADGAASERPCSRNLPSAVTCDPPLEKAKPVLPGVIAVDIRSGGRPPEIAKLAGALVCTVGTDTMYSPGVRLESR